MHLVYIDDSADEHLRIFSALAVPAEQWQRALTLVREFRRNLLRTDGIFVYKEFHAWKFISGRGRIASRVVPKGRRCCIFRDTLQLMASLPDTKLFNVVSRPKEDKRAFERLLNRINRTMQSWDSRAILICDEGKEVAYTRLVRRMRVYNPIPSRFGAWPEGAMARNIPIDHIIEDPFFKKSQKSYFIQLADFAAYALLRREGLTPYTTKYAIHDAFNVLSEILALQASATDPEGIIRL